MNNFEWGLVKARKKMQQKHDHAIIEKMKRGTIIAAIGKLQGICDRTAKGNP